MIHFRTLQKITGFHPYRKRNQNAVLLVSYLSGYRQLRSQIYHTVHPCIGARGLRPAQLERQQVDKREHTRPSRLICRVWQHGDCRSVPLDTRTLAGARNRERNLGCLGRTRQYCRPRRVKWHRLSPTRKRTESKVGWKWKASTATAERQASLPQPSAYHRRLETRPPTDHICGHAADP